MIKEPDNKIGRYFRELLQRIRDIRNSERNLYQQVTDIYATAIDYDSKSDMTREFFAEVQNKMHYATHKHTAAEIDYIDTLDLVRRFYPSLPNHKLDTVVPFLGHNITQHHDAVHDAFAAFHILNDTVRRFGPNAMELQEQGAPIEIITEDALYGAAQ